MDLDYRALSNAGTWCLGRLQTDADRARVLDGLGEEKKKGKLAQLLKHLTARWFVVRDSKGAGLSLLYPRHAISYLRGPMTQEEIRRVKPHPEPPVSAGDPFAALPPAPPTGPSLDSRRQ